MQPSSPLLDPRLLARFAKARIRVRERADGTLSGIHRSPHHGSSVEFTEHKEYSPGDELRHIDWRVYGRTDRYYVKRFEDETNLRAFFVLDCSGSMAYRADTAAHSKFDYAARLTAHLAYLLLQQQDAVGMVAVGPEVVLELPARAASAHLLHILQALEHLTPTGKTDLARGLTRVAEYGLKRGLIFVLSDLFVELDPLFRVLAQLKARRHRVVLLHLLDHDELTFPFKELSYFRALESKARLLAEPRAVRNAYDRALQAFLAQAAARCRDTGIEYLLADTAAPLERPLEQVLLHGAAGKRTRGGGHEL
jgi:uncharacterized protein (DUF58 family)